MDQVIKAGSALPEAIGVAGDRVAGGQEDFGSVLVCPPHLWRGHRTAGFCPPGFRERRHPVTPASEHVVLVLYVNVVARGVDLRTVPFTVESAHVLYFRAPATLYS